MRREIGRWRALANAGAVLAIIALAGFGATRVARRQWVGRDTFALRIDFARVGGIRVGDRARVLGVDAGVVDAIEPPAVPGGPVAVRLRIDARLRGLVRSDARARIASEGVVGAKVVEIAPGLPDAAPLGTPAVIADLVRDAAATLRKVDAAAEAANRGLGEVNAIAGAIARGEGTLGRLVREDEAYRRLVALSDRGEHALGDLEENLAALKHTWPLSRYFDGRAFYDRDRVLYKPGANRDSRSWEADALFEPGRSVLTAGGRKNLDDAAVWFKKQLRPTSEIVIAAYTDPARDADFAQILTQEQADAVRAYLVRKHRIDSVGWFSTRKVAAVGFGSNPPRVPATEIQARPPRRVEIIVFTPQA